MFGTKVGLTFAGLRSRDKNTLLSSAFPSWHTITAFQYETNLRGIIPEQTYRPVSNCIQNALRLLETRRRKTRPKTPAVLDAPTPNRTGNMRGIPSLAGMKEWLRALGHSV